MNRSKEEILKLPACFTIATGNTEHVFKQNEMYEEAEEFLWNNCRFPKTPQNSQMMRRLMKSSAIERRHFSFPDASRAVRTLVPEDPKNETPTITEKNKLYVKEAIPLAIRVCGEAIKQWGGPKEDITHIVSVSCTGMIAPGIDFHVVAGLGLSPNVQRVGVNMMGCYGTTRGMTVAKALAAENPKNRVLMVTCELCSIQFPTWDGHWEEFLGVILFADGCACGVVGVPDPENRPYEKPMFYIGDSHTKILENTPDAMCWWANTDGFRMRLTKEVPPAVSGCLNTVIKKELLKMDCKSEEELEDLNFYRDPRFHYAFHPGGKAILDMAIKRLDLDPDMLKPSREILRDFGNMSASTLMFVLKHINDNYSDWYGDNQVVIGMAFGPGLGVDSMIIYGVPK